ncbi:MAG: hypothetical protein GDA48_08690 [Hormoscilla sp. GM102CHS1]|nr:hypothetical protein [Hormoscilla sp. GM102CHS1]
MLAIAPQRSSFSGATVTNISLDGQYEVAKIDKLVAELLRKVAITKTG